MWVWVILLSFIQGITEFLPVSSSAHLIIPEQLFNIPTLGLSFDVSVHFGTLLAVVFYYRKELLNLIRPVLRSPAKDSEEREQILGLGIATLPAALIGFFAHDIIDTVLRAPIIIAWTTLIFGILLGLADRYQKNITPVEKKESGPSIPNIIIIGLAQSLALIPGVSRSGITMTASLFLGHSKTLAANTSFLLSIPIISMATAYQSYKIYSQDVPIDYAPLLLGVAVSSIVAWLCIKLFMKVISNMGMMPFVIYRLLLAAVLFYTLA